MKAFALKAKTIADPTRIRMLKLLEGGELCVCQIMDILGLGQSTASKHLGILKTAGLVESRKKGTWAHYRLAEKIHGAARDYLEFVASHLNDDEIIKGDKKLLGRAQEKTCRQ